MNLQKQSGQFPASSNNSLIASPVDRNALQNLLPGEKKLIENGLQPRLNELPPVEVELTLNTYILATYTRAGFKNPGEEALALYASEFYSLLTEKFPRVTLAEIKEALKEGVYGEYGEFTGLNPKTFVQFVKGYLFSKDRKEAIAQFESKRTFLKAQISLTPDQREEFNKQFVNELFEDHKAGKLVSDYVPGFIYEFLEQQGRLKLSLEAKKAISERAQKYFLRLKTSKRYKGNARSIGDELAAYIENRDEQLTVKNISKQFAVVDFFDLCKFNGSETIFPQPKLLQ
jgi:hypothetical protein